MDQLGLIDVVKLGALASEADRARRLEHVASVGRFHYLPGTLVATAHARSGHSLLEVKGHLTLPALKLLGRAPELAENAVALGLRRRHTHLVLALFGLLLVQQFIDVGTRAGILDLFVERHALLLGPAAAAAQAFAARPNVHHDVAALGARAVHLELPADLRAVPHAEVVHHERSVHELSLLDSLQLCFVEYSFLS